MVDLFNIIKKTGFMITLIDNNGIILDTYITPNILGKTKINLVNLSEKKVGTNAMGTCLYLDKPIETWGWENAYADFHDFTTSASPIHDINGKLIGCIGITGYADTFSQHTLAMVMAISHTIENQLKLSVINNSKDSFDHYSSIIHQSVSDAIILTNEFGNIDVLNKAAESLFSVSEKELIGKKFDDIVSYTDSFWKYLKKNEGFYQKDVLLDFGNGAMECKISLTHLKAEGKINGRIYIIKKVKDSRINRSYREDKRLYSFDDIIGESTQIKEAIEHAKIASKRHSNVLLMGESGTGKELFAQAIHNYSSRRDQPFVALNCDALPLSLVESELFGYEGGAFTGAKKQGQPGKFELADGGTIFLDEIGEMPLSIQASLLRVIQDMEITRVGGNKKKKVDVMIISATNKNLIEEVQKNNFRLDLFYRLNVFNITISPLRERKEDIVYLVKYFINKYNKKFLLNIQGIEDEVLDLFMHYHWLGNVRELENVLERAVQVTAKNYLTIKDIPIYLKENLTNKKSNSDLPLIENREKDVIVKTLKETKGNIKEASKILGIGRSTLYRKLSKYLLNIEDYRNNNEFNI
ncbi:sigma-54-dependent Fis family transcriptional regulator [Alkalibaculum bacchi]|uniref:sigma-54 interaction domain-containing protein n=1 Tax=Alkalibaculum bacchi TaxID=645887 RepID=UPI0026F18996|nr:sigma 54-interacting transcriptional regulator [Alkalibaculum bacchi]